MKIIKSPSGCLFFSRPLLVLGALILAQASTGFAASHYLGDSAAEGANVTAGTGQDGLSTAVTYAFIHTGATYTNSTDAVQLITPAEVNFYTGSVSGTLTPFIAVYTGNQTPASLQNAANYKILLIGDPISTTGNSGRQNKSFRVKGLPATVNLEPDQVLATGYLASAGGIVKYGGGDGTNDYVALIDTLPASVPNPFTASAGTNLDRTLKYNVGFETRPAPLTYVGDAAAEGPGVTTGTNQDSLTTAVTYDFVNPGAAYANATTAMQQITVSEVNFYAGSVSGTLTPFVSLYTGDQTPASVKNAANYKVLLIGDPIATTGNSGRQNKSFLVNGVAPKINVAPGQIVTAGYVASAGGIVKYSAGVGTIDYVALVNTLPGSAPGAFTASAGTNLDRTLKYNVGLIIRTAPISYLGDDAYEGAGVTNGTGQDTLSTAVTYGFVNTGAAYVNSTDSLQKITLSEVNFYAGSVSGTVKPFVALYTGNQTTASIQNAANYQVLLIGDSLGTTGNSGRQNRQFLVGGLTPAIALTPHQVLVAGYVASAGGVVKYASGGGKIDYIALANTLPGSVPNSFTANVGTNLDRTLKYNIGFKVGTGPFKILCVGDSITAGAGSTGDTKRYPQQLQALLGDGTTVVNQGVSGTTMLRQGDSSYWNTSYYLNRAAVLPDIVIMMLGTNDSKPQNWAYKAAFLSDYTDMLKSYRALASHPVIYVNTSPTVAGIGNYGITNPIVTNEVVPLIKQVAGATGAHLIDVNAGTANIPLDFPDRVHPNDAGYLAIANIVRAGLTGTQTLVSEGAYKIIGKYAGKPVEVAAASLANGAKVDIQDDNGSLAQKWILSPLGGGYYELTNANSGKVADVSGTSVIQNPATGTVGQQWQIVDVGLGSYKLVNRGSGLVWDVTGASPANGTLLQQTTGNPNADQQKFQLIKQ